MAITFVKRPTSPLHFEPIETPPEGVLYPGSDQEEEYDEGKRAKKKLRIELLAQQYLEGRGLLIQSAALRGPFDKGWVNPWASKKRKRGVHSMQWSSRVPATEEGRLKYTELKEGSSTVKRRPVRDVELAQPDNNLEKRASTARRSTEQEEHTAKRRRHEPLEQPNGHHDAQRPVDADSPAYTTQQEYWLKTNKPYLQRGARKDRKSPTPTPIVRNGAQKPVTPPPHTKPQSQTKSVLVTPTTQRKYGEPAGFTSINRPLVSKDRENPPANISRTRSDPQHDKAATEESEHIRVKQRDLATADEMTKRGYKEVKRLSQEAVRQTELNDGVRQAKRSSQKAFQPCYLGTLGKSGRLEPYVSMLSLTDDAKSTAGLRASSKPPKPSARAVPPSTYVPEFQYRYAGKVHSYGSSREDASFVEAPEEDQRSRATSSSSSGSDSFAEALGAAQVKADSKQMASSHSSSPVVEDHETTSVKKNTSAMRRLTFTPSGTARVAQRRNSSRPSSSSSSAGPRASPPKEREGKENARKENALLRMASTKSSDLPISNGNHSRNSLLLPEAQIAENALVHLSQKPSGPSTNLLETDKPSPKFPSLDEGDSYVNLSTQAAFLKAQRSFKDDILSSLKDSPTKKIEKCQAALRPEGADVTPPANSGRPNGSVAQWNNVNPQDSDDEGPMSTQAMVDAMSPFAVTTVKKHPPALQERTSFAPSPTRQKSPTPAPGIPPGSPTTATFRQFSPLRSFNEEFANTLPQKPASKNTTKVRPRQPACNNCRKNKVSVDIMLGIVLK
ncbi:hypothetical protein OEA41_005671 [Lepraria neglecta]|uniref:Uncharacterized protein n=1 Tax=Lepraria neglecta TaxID=209136 RepID=A0AAD9Z6L2_9LECA|nr:hypothetical protein OEA41_005671 [Lepraria neglecta]